MQNFFRLDEYHANNPDRPLPAFSAELQEILKYPIARYHASQIIDGLIKSGLFKFPVYLDKLIAVNILTAREITPDSALTKDFWDNFDRFCTALVAYFASEEGSKKRPHGPVGTTLGRISGTNPIVWETTPRKRGHRRRPY